MSSLKEFQENMRLAYLDGAPGMLVSAAVWITAGVVCLQAGTEKGLWTLLIGGALIHPISTVAIKLAGRPVRVAADNPLVPLAFATTIWLIVCCALAYGLSRHNVNWFFPAMMLVIGSRYLTFRTLFGHPLYSLCGGVLIATGCLTGMIAMGPAPAAFAGGGIEALFGLLLMSRVLKPSAA